MTGDMPVSAMKHGMKIVAEELAGVNLFSSVESAYLKGVGSYEEGRSRCGR